MCFSNFAEIKCVTLCVQGDIAKLREVYDAFFAEYPLCFGYWKKFADAENRHGSPEAALGVYERGVAAIPYSVDLWGHYASFKQTIGASSEDVQRCVCSNPVLHGLLHPDRISAHHRF